MGAVTTHLKAVKNSWNGWQSMVVPTGRTTSRVVEDKVCVLVHLAEFLVADVPCSAPGSGPKWSELGKLRHVQGATRSRSLEHTLIQMRSLCSMLLPRRQALVFRVSRWIGLELKGIPVATHGWKLLSQPAFFAMMLGEHHLVSQSPFLSHSRGRGSLS